jgi:magnesium-transporting ATPase (P-type)
MQIVLLAAGIGSLFRLKQLGTGILLILLTLFDTVMGLLDNGFAAPPGVVAEGRRVTANIERVANLFIIKTAWATLLAVATGAALIPYPFLPRHLTIIDTLAIGVPAFFLALAPNRRRYLPGFAGRVLRFTVPAGLIIAAATFSAYALVRARGLPLTEQRTAVPWSRSSSACACSPCWRCR